MFDIKTIKVAQFNVSTAQAQEICNVTNMDWVVDREYDGATRLLPIDQFKSLIKEDLESNEYLDNEDVNVHLKYLEAMDALLATEHTHVCFI